MKALPDAPDWLQAWTAAERPDLWEATRSDPDFDRIWPEYNLHGDSTSIYFGHLIPAFARFQVLLVDGRDGRDGRVVRRGRTIPFRWDGSLNDLPRGIDAVGLRAVQSAEPPTAVSALAAEVLPGYQGQNLSRLVLQAMVAVTRDAGLGPLVAPVRPSHKDRYPITPIERYAAWRRHDNLAFDPWMRVHQRLGATILRCEPASMTITAPVPDWERWTGMSFPENGDYVFPGGLAPLSVNAGTGAYWEPNVWMLHPV